jgi:NAD+ synthase (glutamine-hydrolysing)
VAETDGFFNLYNQAFIRAAVAIPTVRVADPAYNAEQTVALMRAAAERQAALALFPELGLSAYSCDDLFHQRVLLDAVLAALGAVVAASRDLPLVAVVGLPLEIDHRLFNCAAVVAGGRLLGLTPKTYLPNYREFYEARQFSSGDTAVSTTVDLLGQRGIPFGSRLLFQLLDQPLATFHIEICEDLWVPIPPSSSAALAGATLLLNLSASNITIGKADYRRQLVAGQCALPGGSSTRPPASGVDHRPGLGRPRPVYENGSLLAESRRFTDEPQLIDADLTLSG